MFLTAISVALAGEYSYEYTGAFAGSTVATRADCYFVETPVTVTSIGAYVKKSTSASSSSFYIVLWREEAEDDWADVDWISASQSDTTGYDFIEKSVSWSLEAGESYCLGHTGSNMLGFGIDEDVADPVFGYMRGSADATGSGNLVDVPTRSATIDTELRLTVEVEDADGDGVDAITDCDDHDAQVFPGATETWYDGVDTDCGGRSDYDQDGDGFDVGNGEGEDCDDTDGDVNPRAGEVWYDGVDGDCAGDSDYDRDGDGDDATAYGGGDCDDEDPAVSTNAEEAWYDGFDQDCSGTSDYDQDGDGHETPSAGGDDCDDTDAALALDCSAGGGDDDDGENDDGDGDDDDEKTGGCLCAATSAAPVALWLGLAAAAMVRSRSRATRPPG